jgi:hypothetical protein
MAKRIFVRVVGFTDVERHALNTVFRLSQEPKTGRDVVYEAWAEGSASVADLVLIDGASSNASQELDAMHDHPLMGLIWVGAISPAQAWRTFSRPLRWPDVLTAMDMYFVPAASLDFDLGSETLPDQLEAAQTRALQAQSAKPEVLVKRALVADADRTARLYLLSKLAAAGIVHVDEADSVAQAQALLAQYSYGVVSIDLALSDADPWLAVTAASAATLRLVTGHSIGLGTMLSAKVNGCIAMEKPLHPGKLSELLEKLP